MRAFLTTKTRKKRKVWIIKRNGNATERNSHKMAVNKVKLETRILPE